MDGLLITNAENRRYISSFTGTAGVVLISKTEAKFLTDFRYDKQARSEAVGFDVVVHDSSEMLLSSIREQCAEMGIDSLGFEANDVNYNLYQKLSEYVSKLVPTTKLVEKLRLIKSDYEIEMLKKAAEIGDAAFTYIQDFIRPGKTELDVAHELEYVMRQKGASSSSSQIIVASGKRSALPHGYASSKVIEQGDMVTLDFGALFNGYRSDMTRTVCVGEPHPELKKIYDIVHDVLQFTLDSVKPNMPAKEVDAITRDYISKHGYGDYFKHGTGHGIGLDIHEDPFFSALSEQTVLPGMIVTIEPGIYIPDLGGVRIEDDVLIKEDGIEILTHSPKHLLSLA